MRWEFAVWLISLTAEQLFSLVYHNGTCPANKCYRLFATSSSHSSSRSFSLFPSTCLLPSGSKPSLHPTRIFGQYAPKARQDWIGHSRQLYIKFWGRTTLTIQWASRCLEGKPHGWKASSKLEKCFFLNWGKECAFRSAKPFWGKEYWAAISQSMDDLGINATFNNVWTGQASFAAWRNHIYGHRAEKKMAVSSREKLPRSNVSFAEGDRSILAVSQSKPTPSKLECKSF